MREPRPVDAALIWSYLTDAAAGALETNSASLHQTQGSSVFCQAAISSPAIGERARRSSAVMSRQR